MHRPTSRNLGGTDWRLGYVKGPAEEPEAGAFDVDALRRWVPARVPGNVRDDLMRAGLLPDLYHGRACLEHHWVNDCLWWYERPVEVRRRRGQRVFLDFRGVDYRCAVFWNRTRLGTNDGMYSRLLYDITSLVEDLNYLRVRVSGPKYLPKPEIVRRDSLARRIAGRSQRLVDAPRRLGTLKCQMGYGWDFAPELQTIGIWDDVFLHTSGAVFLERVSTASTLSPDYAQAHLCLRAAANTTKAGEYTLQVIIAGDNHDAPPQTFEFSVYFQAGREVIERNVVVQEPRLWQTWERGTPALYHLTVRVLAGDAVVDEITERIGFRHIEMTPTRDAPAGGPNRTFTLNGAPVFVRGANWVPADCLPGRLRREDYAELIDQARDANINMLRVWGGGLREKAAFYDLCSAAGIMVWQDFPFVGGPKAEQFPRTRSYLEHVEKEVGAIVKAVHNSPALVAYCGGHELDPEQNEHLIEVMRRVLTALDPSRPFFEATPGPGDVHNWTVWHGQADVTDYGKDTSQFCSECGLQAPPVLESLEQFLPAESLWPPNDDWRVHGAQLKKLQRYAAQFGESNDLASFIQVSQQAQAIGLQLALEHARRRKYGCSGIMFWQFNDPWPAISWSVVDYFHRPKAAYETICRAYQPVLVSVRYPLRRHRPGDAVTLDVWVINDTLEVLEECRAEIFMLGEEGRVFSMGITIDAVPANAAGPVLEFDLVLPDREDWTLYAELRHAGRVISSNHYDLRVHQVSPAPARQLVAPAAGIELST